MNGECSVWLCGQNLGYDIRLLTSVLERMKLDPVTEFEEMGVVAAYDTLKVARRVNWGKTVPMLDGKKSFSLGAMYSCLTNKILDNAHDAEADVMATIKIMTSDLFTEFLARDIDEVALDIVAVVSHIQDGRKRYFEEKVGDQKSASGIEIALNTYSKSKNRKKLEFPNLNSYLRVVVYYHADRLGLEVTKKDQSQNTKTLVVAKPKQNK